MRIHTVKKNIRSNHTIRWAGYRQDGTKRNGIVNGKFFTHYMTDYASWATTINNAKYYKYFSEISAGSESQDNKFILNIEPSNDHVIKYDSRVRCCQKCGGKRFNCKGIFHDANAFGKGIYRQGKKYDDNSLNIYEDCIKGNTDAYYDIQE